MNFKWFVMFLLSFYKCIHISIVVEYIYGTPKLPYDDTLSLYDDTLSLFDDTLSLYGDTL